MTATMSNSFPYFSYVESGIKGGVRCDLAPKTVLVGRNGAGKSAIVQALELATKGEITDAEEREVLKLSAAICRQFSGPPYSAKAILRHKGQSFDFTWSTEPNNSGGFKEPTTNQPYLVKFPLADYQAILKGDAKTVGSWLESQVSSHLTTDDIINLITPTYRDLAESFLARQSTTDLIALGKLAADESRKLKTKATQTEKTVKAMTQGVSAPLTATKEAELNALLESHSQFSQSGLTKAEYDLLQLEGHELERQISSLPKLNDKELAEQVKYIHTTFHHMVNKWGYDNCRICGQGDEASLKQREIKINNAAKLFADSVKRIDLEARFAEVNKKLVDGFISVDTTKMDSIRTQLANSKAAKRVWDNAKATQLQVSEDRAQAEMLSLLGQELTTLGKDQLKQNISGFSGRVNNYLASEELGVDLDTSRLGFLRDGRIHSGLSGGESNQMLLALGSTLADGSTPSVLIPRDRAWDSDTLTQAMRVLVSAPVQIIIMTTVEPSPVSGWLIQRV